MRLKALRKEDRDLRRVLPKVEECLRRADKAASGLRKALLRAVCLRRAADRAGVKVRVWDVR